MIIKENADRTRLSKILIAIYSACWLFVFVAGFFYDHYILSLGDDSSLIWELRGASFLSFLAFLLNCTLLPWSLTVKNSKSARPSEWYIVLSKFLRQGCFILSSVALLI
jgi:hypothetical protein